MKLKYFTVVVLTFLIFNSSFLIATIRYVSKTGSSTFPYTSWLSAADSIQKCINVCLAGDTVYVANGVYKEQVVMIPGLSLIGAGLDSCIVDTRDFSSVWPFISVAISDSCVLRGFKIIVANTPVDEWGIGDTGTTGSLVTLNRITSSGIGIEVNNLNINNYSNLLAYKNIIDNVGIGIDVFNSNSIIRNNSIIILQFEGAGISFGAYNFTYTPVIDSNYIETISKGIGQSFGSRPTISNNTIVMKSANWGIYTGITDSGKIFNNLIISENGGDGIDDGGTTYLQLNNNYVTGSFYDHPNFWAINLYSNHTAKNNIVTNAVRGIKVSGMQNLLYQYNNVWNTDINYYGFTPDSTNMSVDPMIVNDDSTQGELDFHLQKYSPLIDAGDPAMIDKDSSRIDIGLYGGLYGDVYQYLDLTPRTPINLTAEIDTITITLKWNRNTEADTSYYKVYRDTVISFQIDSSKLISSPTDTFFVQSIPNKVRKYVYKITCVDKQGNESNPSEEVVVDLTSVSTDDYPIIISDYVLYQNYPNPFNPSTTICYRLKERGYVKMYVYDVKGELVAVLVNQNQEAGYYEVEFSAIGGQASSIQNPESSIKALSSGVYIYQIMVRNENNIPVFSDIKKMIYLK
ncbi:MAG: hypothetical protein Q8M94_12540 [Ignavibacteria bacterium]|nr:hypothetical protein [Ignavibacteria bacterium]